MNTSFRECQLPATRCIEATLPISKASSLLEIVHLPYAYITIRYMGEED